MELLHCFNFASICTEQNKFPIEKIKHLSCETPFLATKQTPNDSGPFSFGAGRGSKYAGWGMVGREKPEKVSSPIDWRSQLDVSTLKSALHFNHSGTEAM
ncbi:hypothetical protein TNCT_230321 [Trichonephila clavata]|uniref:Uncharacterized protein n=1 Tax=Trichonephila clavata TaxID=2740835 RepID=A0A8X6HLW0_TRICU|nr:hypothetical protein TNCT_230321 [Trichonephila clavata]